MSAILVWSLKIIPTYFSVWLQTVKINSYKFFACWGCNCKKLFSENPITSAGLEYTFFFSSILVLKINTTNNEMFLKVLLIIGNRFFISAWKYWIWISKSESIFSVPVWKGCWLLYYQKLCVGVSLCLKQKNTV